MQRQPFDLLTLSKSLSRNNFFAESSVILFNKAKEYAEEYIKNRTQKDKTEFKKTIWKILQINTDLVNSTPIKIDNIEYSSLFTFSLSHQCHEELLNYIVNQLVKLIDKYSLDSTARDFFKKITEVICDLKEPEWKNIKKKSLACLLRKIERSQHFENIASELTDALELIGLEEGIIIPEKTIGDGRYRTVDISAVLESINHDDHKSAQEVKEKLMLPPIMLTKLSFTIDTPQSMPNVSSVKSSPQFIFDDEEAGDKTETLPPLIDLDEPDDKTKPLTTLRFIF
jgi:hypothetical protein